MTELPDRGGVGPDALDPGAAGGGGTPGEDGGRLVVVRCLRCGDTFPVHADAVVACPSCGSTEHAEAAEPLL